MIRWRAAARGASALFAAFVALAGIVGPHASTQPRPPPDPPVDREEPLVDPFDIANEALRLAGEGRPVEAAPVARRAWRAAEERYGGEDERTAMLAQLAGDLYRQAGRADEAVPLLRRALGIFERNVTPNPVQVAGALNALALAHMAQGRAAEALPLLQRALPLREREPGPGEAFLAATLGNLGAALDELGRHAEALPLHERALAIRERQAGPEDPRTATALNNLAETLGELGRYAQALPLHQRALAIREKVLGAEHPDTATSLGNLAELWDSLDRPQQALALSERALAASSARLGANHPSTLNLQGNLVYKFVALARLDDALALAQRTLAAVRASQGEEAAPAIGSALLRLAYVHQARGEFALALPFAQQALANRESARGAMHAETAVALNNLAEIHAGMGEYGRAMVLHRRALAVREAVLGAQHPEIASSLNNLASLHQALGQFDEAEPLLRRALALNEAAYGPEHTDVARSLNNLGHLLLARRQPAAALPLLQRALAVQERAAGAEHPQTAVALNNVASALEDLGRGAEALPLHQRALAIRERAFGPMHASVALTLNNLAALLETLGRDDEALANFRRALRIAQAAQAEAPQPVLLAAVHTRLAGALHRRGAIDAAIFHLKQAVNATQGLRAGATTLDPAARQSLARSVAPRFERLAQWLVQEGRLPEAEQVLALLKLDERRELVRGDAADRSNESALAALSPAERELAERLNDNALKLARSRAELDALAPGQVAERTRLLDRIQAEGEALDGLLGEIVSALANTPGGTQGAARPSRAAAAFTAAVDERDAIAARLATLEERSGARAAALYLVPGEKATTFLFVTAAGAVGRVGGLGEADLNRLVAELRRTVEARSPDYKRSAGALHAALIAPVAPLLAAAHTDTLMLYLAGSLRYAPVAALYDDKAGRHLVEQVALAVYMVGGLRDALSEPPQPRWTVAGLGVSRALAGFDALPAVPAELASVVRIAGEPPGERAGQPAAGVLPGERFLDEAFTRERLAALARRGAPFAVLHVATHFKLIPGREDESHLLLGDGDLLSMRQLRSDPTLALSTYDLVTLSACNTSMGGGNSGERAGAEFEGLATTLMRKGARAVMATLWEVQDTGTAALMRSFYAARGEARQVHKAQALRQAQTAMLRGDVRDPAGRLDLRHPYYWAPFILMGNWL